MMTIMTIMTIMTKMMMKTGIMIIGMPTDDDGADARGRPDPAALMMPMMRATIMERMMMTGLIVRMPTMPTTVTAPLSVSIIIVLLPMSPIAIIAMMAVDICSRTPTIWRPRAAWLA